MNIAEADPTASDIRGLLEQHMAAMTQNSPPGACHVLDMAELQAPEVTFWAARTDGESTSSIMGCGAMKEIAPDHGEIKSMRVHDNYLRKGVGGMILDQIMAMARLRGYSRISLETGSGSYFDAAHRLYLARGFVYCGPFGDYPADNTFARYMTIAL